MPTIRPAAPSEDPELSRIYANAFLHIWNHNWFQCVSEPLPPVPVKDTGVPVAPLLAARVRFYLSLIKSTRLLGGEVLVNIVDEDGEPEFGAILLWTPPHARMTIRSLWMMYHSGFLRTLYDYGPRGVYRTIFVFEGNIEEMFKAANVHEVEYDFVQMLASNPKFAGRGLASQLLRWRVQRCDGGVVMDTTTGQARRAYEKMGFKVLGTREVSTGCDELGIALKDGQEEAKHVQMVLMLRKGEYIEAR